MELREFVDDTLRRLEGYAPFEGEVKFAVDAGEGRRIEFACLQPYLSVVDKSGIPRIARIPPRLTGQGDRLKTETVNGKEAIQGAEGIPARLDAVGGESAV